MSLKRIPLTAALVLSIVAAGCSGNSGNPEVTVTGAQDAVREIANFTALTTISYRPAALVGIYASIFYANGDYLPVASARSGVTAQMQLHARPTEESMNTTYDLLEEFGMILRIDIPDLLNRSADRAHTLSEYTTGLNNITARAERRLAESTDYLANLRDKERDARKQLSDANRLARKALDDGDFSLASERQKEAGELQKDVAEIDAEQAQFTQLQRYTEELVDVAHARQLAIEQNREILIAGLKVVDVPGAENIGVLEPTNRRSGGSRLMNF